MCEYQFSVSSIPNFLHIEYAGVYILSSSSLARQPYVDPGLPQKLLPAEVSGYCLFRFRGNSFFQGGAVSTAPNPRLSWMADVFCQLTSPNVKASRSRFLPLHDLAVYTLPRSHDVNMHATDLVGILEFCLYTPVSKVTYYYFDSRVHILSRLVLILYHHHHHRHHHQQPLAFYYDCWGI
jgi:hypothetical protein